MIQTKACIIIGAGPGLGTSIARRFEREGYKTAVVSRSDTMADSGLDRVRWFQGDVASETSTKSAIDAATQWAGGADVLVYNAASLGPTPIAELDSGKLLSELAVNVGGAVTAVGCILPHFRDRGSGTLLFTGGGLANLPHPAWSALGMGKAALLNYSRALRAELQGSGIRVSTISICGVIERGGPFDPDTIAEVYWTSHSGPEPAAEIVYRPEGADPFYNERAAAKSSDSLPGTKQ